MATSHIRLQKWKVFEGGMIHGTDCALRNSIHFELGSVYSHRILVCRASSIRAATGGSLNATTMDPCLSHAGGTILAPGAVDVRVPTEFRMMIGFGDLATAVLALLALIALRNRYPGAIAMVWLCIIVGTLDTVNAIIQSVRDSVFTYALGVNWVIVSIYVPALLVSSLLIFLQLLRPNPSTKKEEEKMVTSR